MEVRRTILELLERQDEEPTRGTRAAFLDVDAGGSELDQALKVPAFGSGAEEPDRLPAFVGLEEAPLAECRQAAADRLGGGRVGNGQAFGSAEMTRSISAASTYPSIRFTTFPEPSRKRTVG